MGKKLTKTQIGYQLGYRDGQADILDYLRGELDEVAEAIACDFCLWCIGWNLSLVGALEHRFKEGKAWAWNNGGGYKRDEWEKWKPEDWWLPKFPLK